LNLCNKKIYFLISLVLVTGVAQVAERIQFYYFNPDSIKSNLRQLKSNMDSVLQKNNIPAAFQPFAKFSDFNDNIRTQRPSLLYVPYWYFERYGKELKLRPLLTSLQDKKTNYQKKLITNINSKKSIGHLDHSSLAMTTMGPDSKSMLNNIVFSDNSINTKKFSIIEVPKDIDAIFAVALGQVDSALVSSINLQLLEKRNPRLTKSIRVIANTKPMTLPILCYLEGTLTEEKIKELRVQLKNTDNLEQSVAQVLGVDAWGPKL